MRIAQFVGISAGFLLAGGGVAMAAETTAPGTIAPVVYAAPVSPFGGVFSAWGQGVLPAFGRSGEDVCDDGYDVYCALAYGAGGYMALVTRMENIAILLDLTIDYHTDTNLDPVERTDPSLYGGAGLHIVHDGGGTQVGIFGVAAMAYGHTDGDPTGLALGGGIEFRVGDFYVQAGGLFDINDPDGQDSLRNLFFARAVQEIPVGTGRVTAGLAGGYGNFNDSGSNGLAPGIWLQLAMQYQVPLGQSNLHWMIAYQGDFMIVREESGDEQVLLNALRMGFTMPFGGGAGPFTTPDFHAPIANAGQLN